MASLTAKEAELLRNINVACLSKPTWSEILAELSSIIALSPLQQTAFKTYIDNYALFLLLDASSNAEVFFKCLIACIIFFETHDICSGTRLIVDVFRTCCKINSSFFTRFEFNLHETAQNLKSLGNKPKMVESVASSIEPRRLMLD